VAQIKVVKAVEFHNLNCPELCSPPGSNIPLDELRAKGHPLRVKREASWKRLSSDYKENLNELFILLSNCWPISNLCPSAILEEVRLRAGGPPIPPTSAEVIPLIAATDQNGERSIVQASAASEQQQRLPVSDLQPREGQAQ
jgi:hypothetical protein